MSVKSILELDEYKQYEASFTNRVNTLKRRSSYYDGSIYTDKLRNGLGYLAPRLYQGIKPLFLPLSRAVDIDAGIIPGGWELPDDEPKRDIWQKAINTVFDWSHWDTDGVLFVHYGAQYGVSGLRIVDARDESRVIIQPSDPTLFMLVGNSTYDSPPDMAIYIEQVGVGKEQYEYAEVTTPETIKTYKAGAPFGYDGREPEYSNELGFVPYVEVRHIETGKPYGEATFDKVTILLDEVNEIASYLADLIKKNADPQWVISGAEPSDLEHGGGTVWFVPAGADVKPLIPGIDIDGVLAFVQSIAQNVKEGLPELAFDDIKQKTQIATATLELQLMELVLKVKRTRPNYDRGLTTALQMAGKAAKTMSLGDISVLDDDGLHFDQSRDILPADVKQQLEIRIMKLELERLENATITEGMDVQTK